MTEPHIAERTSRQHHSSVDGQMTAVMRAVPRPTAEKALRVGLVRGGKVVDERMLEEHAHASIGPNERSLFVLPPDLVPHTFRLFEWSGRGYLLNVTEEMTGRVATNAGMADLADLRLQAQSKSSAARGGERLFQIPLSDDSRGKVVLGETTFLFQFVARPVAKLRPQLPPSIKSGLQIDWTTTLIAAFSFLFHFGLIGSIYSDWMDPTVDTNIDVEQLVETVKALPPPPAEEKENVDSQAVAAATAVPTDHQPSKSEPSKAAGISRSQSTRSSSRSASDARAAALSSEMAQLDVAMLATLNGAGPNTERLLEGSTLPLAMLDEAAKNGAGASSNASVFNLPGDGNYQGHRGQGSFTDDKTRQHSGNDGPGPKAGEAVTHEGPKGGNVFVQPPGGTTDIPGLEGTVAQMAPGFRRCYQKALPSNPDMKGTVRITVKVGPNGDVLGASPSGGGSLSGDVISCVVNRVASSHFSPPTGGGSAVFVIPVSFMPQQ